MSTLFLSHPDCLTHQTPPGHPEQIDRLVAVEAALSGPDFDTLQRARAPLAEKSDLLRCHPAAYLDRITKAIPAAGIYQLDADTHVSPGSHNAALRAAGGACHAVDQVMQGGAINAFVATRPPGHHAEHAQPMGFCIYGNAAIAAKRALDHHGLSRVAVVDFDVHHGNGTQDLLWDESRALFISSHQMPLWPGSGREDERGNHGNIVNIPLPPGSDGAAMRKVYEAIVLPQLDRFAPELLIISAGFDAHADDPLAQLEWREADFAWATRALCDIAARHCDGRVVSVLEGGYDLDALGASVAAHIKVLMEQSR